MGRREWIGREVRNLSSPVPLVEIADDRRVLIEHHQGVCSYTADQVTVRVRYGQVCITGCRLYIARMTREQLVVCGVIDGISLVKAGGKHGQ